jgi:uncharacterized membrane protein
MTKTITILGSIVTETITIVSGMPETKTESTIIQLTNPSHETTNHQAITAITGLEILPPGFIILAAIVIAVIIAVVLIARRVKK